MNEVLEFLTTNSTFYLATIDEDNQARVRPFGAIAKFEDKLYFATNNTKSVFKQLVANPKVEISTTSKEGAWISLSGSTILDTRTEAKVAMLEAVPMLKKMYTLEDDVFAVFYLTDGVAVFNSFSDPTPKTVQI